MKTHSSLISFPLSYHYNHSLYTGILFEHLKISMIKPLYKKGDRTSVANSVNQSVDHFSHPLCQVFGIGHTSKIIGLKFTYSMIYFFCLTQWLALSVSVISGGGDTYHSVRIPVLNIHSSSKRIYSQ